LFSSLFRCAAPCHSTGRQRTFYPPFPDAVFDTHLTQSLGRWSRSPGCPQRFPVGF